MALKIHPDTAPILKEAAKRVDVSSRRLFLRNALGLGTLSLLSGCDITDGFSADSMLTTMSDFNDRAQAWLFRPDALAQEYDPARITRPFPFNSFYVPNVPEKAPTVDPVEYRLSVSGMVAKTDDWTLDQLYALPQSSQITRHICIEGWSAIGKFTGVRLSDFLKNVGADLTAKYITFNCADNYVTSIDMASALHAQTQLTFKLNDEILPRPHGFPVKLRIPTKLGFKNPKHIVEIEVGNEYVGGYWETYGYNWFSGL